MLKITDTAKVKITLAEFTSNFNRPAQAESFCQDDPERRNPYADNFLKAHGAVRG